MSDWRKRGPTSPISDKLPGREEQDSRMNYEIHLTKKKNEIHYSTTVNTAQWKFSNAIHGLKARLILLLHARTHTEISYYNL